MALKLYNTLTRKLEILEPLDGKQIRMYTCGPTVYHYVHIGNFRTFTFQDILRRYILYKGFDLLHVMNITDVEDKIIAGAGREGVPIFEYTQKYEQAFLDDMEALNIERPEIMPKATDHIEDMLELIERLKEKDYTYQSDGSLYYRIARFDDYGKLSGLSSEEVEASSSRVDEDEYTKENPRDFVLWKGYREGETSWDSRFGKGRPGWHIECSAMSMKYLGESFDIHCGGVDLIFPHHENEIAQSEAATGAPFVRHWVHGAHLIVNGQKMSKSLGNFYTLRDLLEQGCKPLALRYLLSSVHYRNQLNFTFEGLEQAEASINRINDFVLRIREVSEQAEANPELTERVALARRKFEGALDDDLNTSSALAALFELVKDVNIELEEDRVGGANRKEILSFLEDVNRIFAVFELEPQEIEDEEIKRLIQEREEARRSRDFSRADQIREQLAREGILLEDTKEGTRWKRQM